MAEWKPRSRESFAVKKTSGRPKKKHKVTLGSIFADAEKRQKHAAAAPAAAPEAEAQAAQAEAQAEAKRSASVAKVQLVANKVRRNYSEGPNKQKMDAAIEAFRKTPIYPITESRCRRTTLPRRWSFPRRCSPDTWRQFRRSMSRSPRHRLRRVSLLLPRHSGGAHRGQEGVGLAGRAAVRH